MFALLALCSSQAQPQALTGVSAPVLMWQYGGCLAGPSCQTGWYSSPAVVDLDGDGRPEVIWGAADVVALDGATGSQKWRGPSSNRVWPGVVVADLTGDGTPEVIVGRNNDRLTAYDRLGHVLWTRTPFGGGGELRTLAAADLDNDGRAEIVVGTAAGVTSGQVEVLASDGTVRPGWPALRAGEPGFGGGLWNADVAVADVNGDGFKEVFAGNGSHYVLAFDRGGNQLPVNGIYAPRQFWSEVGFGVDNAVDLRGWINCGIEHRPDFSLSAPVIADVNGDGVPELIVVGNVRNCGTVPYTDLYQMPFLLNRDRTRWSGSGFDWTVIPAPGPGSAPRSVDFDVIENAMPNAVVADLDGDGLKEILFPSYDGKVHAYWLDKTEHGNWPYTVPTSGAAGDDFRFASEPTVADLDNDGHAEVIFASWPKKATGRAGQLHVLSYLGVELYRLDLPVPANGATWNGALGAPTIANIDSDANLELVMGTAGSGVVAYKLPDTANARVLWGTGRGNYQRTGTPVSAVAPPPDVTPPTVTIASPASGATLSGTISVTANAADNVGVVGVQFLLDGTALGPEDTVGPYSVSWNTTTAINGAHGLSAVARDAADNTTTSSAVTVTVDNVAPTVAITAPAGGASLTGTTTVSASASDNVGVIGVQFKLDGANLGAEVTVAPYAVSWDTTKVTSGAHTLSAVARDAAGNTTTSAAVTVTVDNVAPTVTVTAPAGGASLTGTTTVSASASDNVGVIGVQFLLDGVALGAEDTTAPYAVSWSTTTAANGSHTLMAVARDAAGNTTASTAVTVTVSNDLTPPTVAITSPSPGATVKGTIPVAPSASDNVGVVGVQFKLDGANLGAEVTVSPYSVSWDTATAADGAHSLSAVARDAAGNTTTSSAVTVTVDNGTPAVGITAPAAGATVSGTTTVSAIASDTVGVVGVQFKLDGADLGAEDTTAPYAVSWDTTTAASGAHTLSAVARDAAGNTTASAPVTVTTGPVSTTATRFENTEPSITYTDGLDAPGRPPGWWHGSRSRGWSGVIASFNRSQGARARFSFTGTTVRWIGFRAPWAGIARVHVDDVFVVELDLYATTEQAQAVVFERTGLPSGNHTLTVEATGRKNDASADYAVVVDAFDVEPASPLPTTGTRVEETGAAFSAGWTADAQAPRAWSGGTAQVSATPGAQATFTFTGTEVRWVGLRGPQNGVARVFLDGSFQATVDMFAPKEIQAVVYTATGLATARHTLRIDVTGQKNAASTGAAVFVDALDTRGRIEDLDPSIAFGAGWQWGGIRGNWSGSSGNYGAGTAGFTRSGQATISFTGTSVSWIGLRAPWSGMARVLVDGAFVADVDTYAPAEQAQAVLYTAAGLTDAPHTFTVQVNGQKNVASTDSLVIVDAFDLTLSSSAPAITRWQESDPPTTYTGPWTSAGFSFWSGETAAFSGTAGAQATFTFNGAAVHWIGQRSFNGGIARVLLDGVQVAQVDTFAPMQEEFQAVMYSAEGLANTSHTLTIQATGQKNAFSFNPWIFVDAFDTY